MKRETQSQGNAFYDFYDVYHGSVEFWVEELTRKVDSSVTRQRMEKYFQRFENKEIFASSVATRRRAILINAQVLALCSRWKINPSGPIDLMTFFELDEIEILRELIAHKEKLPQLSYKKNVDLKLQCVSVFNMKMIN